MGIGHFPPVVMAPICYGSQHKGKDNSYTEPFYEIAARLFLRMAVVIFVFIWGCLHGVAAET